MLLNRIAFRLVPCVMVLSLAIAGCPKKKSDDPPASTTPATTVGVDIQLVQGVSGTGGTIALSTNHTNTLSIRVTFNPTNIDPLTVVYGDVYGAGSGTIGIFDASNTLIGGSVLETSPGVYLIDPIDAQMSTPGGVYHLDIRTGASGITSTDTAPKKVLPTDLSTTLAGGGTWPLTWAIDASFEADPPVGTGLALTLAASATKAWRSIDVTFAGDYNDNDPDSSLMVVIQRSESATFPDLDADDPSATPGTFADASGVNGRSAYTMATLSGLSMPRTDNSCPNPGDAYFYRVSAIDQWGNVSTPTASVPTSLTTASVTISSFFLGTTDATRFVGFAEDAPTYASSGTDFIDDGFADVADLEGPGDHALEGFLVTDTGGFTWRWVALKDDGTTPATFAIGSPAEVPDVDGVDNAVDNFNVYPGDGSAKGSPDSTSVLTPGTWTATLVMDSDPNVITFTLKGSTVTDDGWHVVDVAGTGFSDDMFVGTSTGTTPSPSEIGATIRYVDSATPVMVWFGRGDFSGTLYSWKLLKTGTAIP